MPKIDAYELAVLAAFEKDRFKPLATKAGLRQFKVAARIAKQTRSVTTKRRTPSDKRGLFWRRRRILERPIAGEAYVG